MKIGTKINGRYQILHLIGSGGMAKVYLAHDLILDRDVAVKMLRLDFRDDFQAIKRFQREALSATELVHPNVVGIYDVGEENGQPYIVMEYVNGTDLKQYIKNNYPISFDQIVKMMDQILSAISLAHRNQIIHRDLKPQNILVDSAGNCKITDFGIALALTETSVTQTNTLLGSVHYLSPEQARGNSATKKSDIYALGIILYEMLTGDVPFDGESAVSIALKHFQEDVPSIKAYYHNVPQALENVVFKATAKNPEDRYRSVDEMRDDLQTVLNASRVNEPVWHPESGKVEEVTNDLDDLDFSDEIDNTQVREQNKKRNKKAKIFIILLILLLLVGGCTALFYSGGRNIDVPDVEGKTIEEATKILKNQGFEVDSHYRYKYDKNIAKDHVIATNPADNEAAKKGDKILLYVSKGEKEFIVKDFTGQSLDDVKKQMIKQGIKRNQIITEYRLSSEYAKGTIMAQETKDSVLKRGQGRIKFIVSSGETGKMKDLKGMTRDEVKQYAEDNQLVLVSQYEYTDDEEENTVLSQDPQKDTEIGIGDNIFVTFAKTPQVATPTPHTQANNGAVNNGGGVQNQNGTPNRNPQVGNNQNNGAINNGVNQAPNQNIGNNQNDANVNNQTPSVETGQATNGGAGANPTPQSPSNAGVYQ